MQNFSDRYILPLFPSLAIIIALTIHELFIYCKRIKILYLFAVLTLVIQLAVSLFSVVRLDYLLLLPETHDSAVNWINKYTPQSASIMCEGQFPRLQGKNITKLLDFFTRKKTFSKKKGVDFFITSSMSNDAFQKLMKCENRKLFYEDLAKKHYLIKTFWFENIGFFQQEIKIFRNKKSIIPPFFSLTIQPYHNNFNAPVLFLDKTYAPLPLGGFIVNKKNHTVFMNSTQQMDFITLYISNLENHPLNISITSGWNKQIISLSPLEKKIIKFSPQLHFPYLKYFYKITIKRYNKNDRLYVKLITDPFNEGLMLCHLNNHKEALNKIMESLSIEKNNPLLHYFHALLLYKNSRFKEAANALHRLPDNWLQLYNSTYFIHTSPADLPLSYQLHSLPPGYYTISFDLDSEEFLLRNEKEEATLAISIASKQSYLQEKTVLRKGISNLAYSFSIPHIDDIIIKLETTPQQPVHLNTIHLEINKEKLLSDIASRTLSFQCWQ
ncbi:MAG: hypothetical protein A2Y62_06935 [Candidatus Fischerbacteria bacterium RBG_13_37_8]|uniref:Uncharacterized protein n=1 Tax=Candidatus Fischerbacteria bacterium RBG_13_37_8 TaxID=1817863 RepID=A0A1F5VMB7_9BACT|nr:MAG: hypothetical protein A2Y62_06935 [Candidatus Fischerbacteria bacterium RBG_13_37_8]